MRDELELHLSAARAAAEAGANVPDIPQGSDAGEMKLHLQEARAVVTTHLQDVLERKAAAKELIDAKKRELDQLLRDLNAELAPLQEKVARFEDGIAAVQLYLGRGEEIYVVRDGTPAPASTQVTLRQETLAMDEESVIAAGEGGIDFRDIELFVEWLQDDEHLDQLLPEPKGVVACQPTRQAKEYTGDPLVDAVLNKQNHYTYWLIRNGERVWLTKGEFIVGNTICPKESEFTGLFRGRDGRPLEPGSSEWNRAEKRADLMTRHYMKVAMLLQGLVDRTAVLDPKPEHLSFIDQASYERGEIRMLTDSERTLTTLRTPFPEWIKAKRAQLVEGMRIAFDPSYSLGFRDRSGDYGDPANSHPEWVTPPAGIYQVKRYTGTHTRSFDFQFGFERTQEVWDPYAGYRMPERRATARFNVGENFWIPIDVLTIDEIDEYLQARLERQHFQQLVPLLNQARALLVEEREAQTPFAHALAGRLMTELDLSTEDAEPLAWDLVDWYRGSRKWQEPVQDDDAKAFTQTMAEARRRLRTTRAADRVLAGAREIPGDLLAVARRSSGYFAVHTQPTRYPQLEHRPFVTITELTATGKAKATAGWQLLKRSQVSRWQLLHEEPAFADLELDVSRSACMTDDEVALAIEDAKHMYPSAPLLLVRVGEVQKTPAVEAWYLDTEQHTDYAGRTETARLQYRQLEIKNGGIGYVTPSRNVRSMRLDKDRSLSGERTYTWETRIWDHVAPDKTVFFDETVSDRARTIADEIDERGRQNRRLSDLALELYQWARTAIEAEQHAELRGRYLDDYGTELGFEEWLSGLNVQARHPDRLREKLSADLRSGRPIGGLTLAELYPGMELWAAAA